MHYCQRTRTFKGILSNWLQETPLINRCFHIVNKCNKRIPIKNNALTAAFLDFEGVGLYDNVDHKILLVKLANFGLTLKLVSFIENQSLVKF